MPNHYTLEGPSSTKPYTLDYWHIDLDMDDNGSLTPIDIDTIATPIPTEYIVGEVPNIEERDLCFMMDDAAAEFTNRQIDRAVERGYAEKHILDHHKYWRIPKGLIHNRPPIPVFDSPRLFGKRFVE